MGILGELIWTTLFFVVLHFVVTPLVNARTGNSWLKLPVLVALGIGAGAIMAYAGYVPLLLVLVWLPAAHSSLKVMATESFARTHAAQIRAPIDLRVYQISTYAFVLVSCGTAWLLQVGIGAGDEYLVLGPALAERIMKGFKGLGLGELGAAGWSAMLVGAYILFSGSLRTHLRHIGSFQGASAAYLAMLQLSVMLGVLTGVALLTYYGFRTSWYWPLVLFFGGNALARPTFGILERVVGYLVLSLASFAWPAAAVTMLFAITRIAA